MAALDRLFSEWARLENTTERAAPLWSRNATFHLDVRLQPGAVVDLPCELEHSDLTGCMWVSE